MLSRTADHLFWMARYMERAENTARMLDVTRKALLLPQSDERALHSLRAVLSISELAEAFAARYDDVAADNVLHFMTADPNNPSSIYSSLRAARENARAVRGTLTTESWETINDTWLDFNRQLEAGVLEVVPDSVFEWVKMRSHLSRGVTLGTALKDEAFYFTQLGTFLERADNTARILDVRFADAAPGARPNAAAQLDDFYYWTSILSSVSGLEIYRQVYRDVLIPERVAELLILNPSMPRSLLASLDRVCENLAMLRTENSRECERYAGKLRAELLYAEIRPILARGLHAYLTEFLGRIATLGNKIGAAFLLPVTS
ncbi:alpha-E domain-containing protein [Pigmentiphaga sp.]|uniref:alpha-E domain-containing protein n=1 Tax=Pigmentiphaga sp. TaxID=1977564 RepID=UPI0025F4672A|nr:alpha-E domain-containing protein [Pigmentiphaga sp.]MBX6318049.1 alpha-E domain-containing protein [Pigmentiphaga sp.]